MLTVYENLEMGALSRNDGKIAIQADIERMFGVFPRLKKRAFQLAGTMSVGVQQMLAISRALMRLAELLMSLQWGAIIVQKSSRPSVKWSRAASPYCWWSKTPSWR
jgi:branched-chain amino acid transport system ATP-binding protein